jgi:hypothetical protein
MMKGCLYAHCFVPGFAVFVAEASIAPRVAVEGAGR